MPRVQLTGTFDKSLPGWEILAASTKPRLFSFNGTSIGGGCTINVKDDSGGFSPRANSTVSALNTEKTVYTKKELEFVFTGSPDLYVTAEYLD